MSFESTIISGSWARQPATNPVPSVYAADNGKPDITRFRVTNIDRVVVITVGDNEIAFDSIRAEVLGFAIITAAKRAML